MPRTPRIKMKSAKQIAAATKNILAYEKKDDFENITIGFILGAVTVLISAFIGLGLWVTNNDLMTTIEVL